MTASQRLTFLYPFVGRSLFSCEQHATTTSVNRLRQLGGRQATLHSKAGLREQLHPRHGTAVEPQNQIGEAKRANGNNGKNAKAKNRSAKGRAEKQHKDKNKDQAVEASFAADESPKTEQKPSSESTDEAEPASLEEGVNPPESKGATSTFLSDTPSTKTEDVAEREPSDELPLEKPLETVLHMDPPSTSNESEAPKPPHLQPSPYVHHFDTYTLVREVEKGSFTHEQAITSMKAVRSLLAVNLDVAQESLVSESDVENETYLFRAACSELRTEIQNNRRGETEKMRTERTQLQHEVDILNQKLTQELSTLKDDLKGMFNDRRMAVRMEQRGMESSIQELNYKITVSLNSDMKSEVEGLRWVLTRRAALAIGIMAFLILGSLRYSSYQLHSQPHGPSASSGESSSGTGSFNSAPSSSSASGRTERGESAEVLANLGIDSRLQNDPANRASSDSSFHEEKRDGAGGPSYVSLG